MKLSIQTNGISQSLNHTIEQFKVEPLSDIAVFDLKNVDKKQCPICLKNFQVGQFLIFSKCGHMFCSSCLVYHISMRIREKNMVRCMEYKCGELLFGNSEHIKALSKQMKDKYFQIILEYTNSELIKCKTEKCTGFIFKNSIKKMEGKSFLTCTQCPNQFCPKCKNQLASCNCEQNLHMFQNLKKDFNFKRCPKCGHAIQKLKGCYHLTCICKYQFCEQCSSEWRPSHICQQQQSQSINLQNNYAPASNQQNDENGNNNPIVLFFKYSLRILVYILISLLIVIQFTVKFGTVLLYIPFFLLAGGVIGFKAWKTKGMKCLLIIFLVIILPISFPAAIVYCIFTDTNQAEQWRSCLLSMLKVDSASLYRQYNLECFNDQMPRDI